MFQYQYDSFCACFIVIVSFTVVLILDGKTQDVAGSKAGAVVHTSVEERMGVGVLDIQDLTRGCHVTRDALVRRDTELFLHTHKVSVKVNVPDPNLYLIQGTCAQQKHHLRSKRKKKY